ncbi:ATP-binding protein [Streptomyces sp. NPDC020379]|uniref:ATP-binding protein n=1 Tax=Streptomyces sp. NPDC020379 TaxID=3365071 RepID=UPI00379537F0
MTLCAESPDTGQAARGMVRSALADWGLNDLVDDVRLAVSELVGDVVHHAVPGECLATPGPQRQLDVTLTKWPKWLLLGVMDEDSSSPTIPVGEIFSPRMATSLPEALLPDRGRGLLIVHSPADALWWAPNESGGKTVVCRFDLDGHPTDGSRARKDA